MKLLKGIVALALVAAVMTSVSFAGGEGCQKTCDKSKSDAKLTAAECKSSGCNLSNCMPKMTMMVGEKSFECPMAASECAKKDGGKVKYAVGKKTYDCQEEAMTAYADVMDDFVAKFATVRTMEECMASCSGSACCSKGDAKTVAAKGDACCASKGDAKTVAAKSEATCSKDKGDAKTVAAKGEGCCSASKATMAKVGKDGKPVVMYCVAGQTFECKDKAEKASKVAMAAMKDVAMKYRVGEKDFCCDKMAGDEMKKTNAAKMSYVVGKDTMDCKVKARIALDRAKVEAAAKALSTMDKVATGA